MADDNPADNKPKPIKYFEKLPNTGSRLNARSVALVTPVLLVEAAHVIIWT